MTTRSGNPSSGISGASTGTGNLPSTWEHPISWDALEKYFKNALNKDTRKVFSMLLENSKSLEDHLDTAYLKSSGGTVAGAATFTGSVTLPGTISLGGTLISTLNFSPTGSITMYGGSSAPAGWLRCDGTAISRTTYSALFSIIGTQYGVGNGSTTFNLPNLQGKFPLGGTSDRGTTGGEADVTLTSAQIPSHQHGVGTYTIPSVGNHDHSFGHTHDLTNKYFQFSFGAGSGATLQALDNTGAAIPGANVANSGVTSSQSSSTTGAAGAHDHIISGSSGSTGGSGSHNNMPPYQVVDYIIKT